MGHGVCVVRVFVRTERNSTFVAKQRDCLRAMKFGGAYALAPRPACRASRRKSGAETSTVRHIS